MLTGDQLRMARAALKLTVKQTADLAGVDKGTIVRIEAGENAYARTLNELRAVLEKHGVVFLDARDGVHRPGVALAWNFVTDSDLQQDEKDSAVKGDHEISNLAWDADFHGETNITIPEAERASLQHYYEINPERWSELSDISRHVLARAMRLRDTFAPVLE